MPFKRRFIDKYAGSSPENASVVRTLFDLFSLRKVGHGKEDNGKTFGAMTYFGITLVMLKIYVLFLKDIT